MLLVKHVVTLCVFSTHDLCDPFRPVIYGGSRGSLGSDEALSLTLPRWVDKILVHGQAVSPRIYWLLMARWRARVEFLLSVIELLFLSLAVEALQGKTCQNSLPSGVRG